eukprot:764867-Hanusia_phi.AAC.7
MAGGAGEEGTDGRRGDGAEALALAHAGDADERVAQVARALLPRDLAPGGVAVDHVALEAQRADVGLVLHDLLPRGLAQHVQLVEVGEEGEVVQVLVPVPVLGEDAHVRLDGVVEVVRVDGQVVVRALRVRVVEDHGVRPGVLDRVELRVFGGHEEGHDEHARALVGLVDRARVTPEGRQRLRAVPVEHLVVHAAVVPVPQADQVALVVDQRLGVVLVLHAPDAVLRVVVASHLRLPPVRRPQLRRAATPEDRRQHVVLDVGPHADEVDVPVKQLVAASGCLVVFGIWARYFKACVGRVHLLVQEVCHPAGDICVADRRLRQCVVELLERQLASSGCRRDVRFGVEEDPDGHRDDRGVCEADACCVAHVPERAPGGEHAAAGHVVVGGVHDGGEHPREGEAVEVGEQLLLGALAREGELDVLLDGGGGDRLVPVLAEAALLEDALDAAHVCGARRRGDWDGVAAELRAERGCRPRWRRAACGSPRPCGRGRRGRCSGSASGGEGEEAVFGHGLDNPCGDGVPEGAGQSADVEAEGACLVDPVQDLVAVVEDGVVDLLRQGGCGHGEEGLAARPHGAVGVRVADVLHHEDGGEGVIGRGACRADVGLRPQVGEAQEPRKLTLHVGRHLHVGEEGVAEPGVEERAAEAGLHEDVEAVVGLLGDLGVEGVGRPDGVEEHRAQHPDRGRHLRGGPGPCPVLGGGRVDLGLGHLRLVDAQRLAGQRQPLDADQGGLARERVYLVLGCLERRAGLAELMRCPVEQPVVVHHRGGDVVGGENAGRCDGVDASGEREGRVRRALHAAAVEVVDIQVHGALEVGVVLLLCGEHGGGLLPEVRPREAGRGQSEGLPLESDDLVLVVLPLSFLVLGLHPGHRCVLVDVCVVEHVVDPGVLQQVLEGDVEGGVLGLVVEAEAVAGSSLAVRAVLHEVLDEAVDAIVLGDAGAPPEHVARGLAGVHAELAGVDDGHAPVAGEVGPLLEEHRPARAVGEVLRLLRVEGHLDGQRAVAHEEGGRLRAPALEGVLGVLDEDVERVGVLLHEAVAVDVLADELLGGLLRGVVLFVEVDLVGWREEERLVHVEVVGLLDGADELHELPLEVLPPVRGHHEVVLHLDGHTLPHDVGGLVGFALGEHPGRGLVGHARGEALVEAPDRPLKLLVGVFEVVVRQDVPGERGVGGVGDEAVHPVRQEVVGPAEDVGEVPALVSLVPLRVELDLPGRGAKDGLVVVDAGLRGVGGHGPP